MDHLAVDGGALVEEQLDLVDPAAHEAILRGEEAIDAPPQAGGGAAEEMTKVVGDGGDAQGARTVTPERPEPEGHAVEAGDEEDRVVLLLELLSVETHPDARGVEGGASGDDGRQRAGHVDRGAKAGPHPGKLALVAEVPGAAGDLVDEPGSEKETEDRRIAGSDLDPHHRAADVAQLLPVVAGPAQEALDLPGRLTAPQPHVPRAHVGPAPGEHRQERQRPEAPPAQQGGQGHRHRAVTPVQDEHFGSEAVEVGERGVHVPGTLHLAVGNSRNALQDLADALQPTPLVVIARAAQHSDAPHA